jgi:hypothetical protein
VLASRWDLTFLTYETMISFVNHFLVEEVLQFTSQRSIHSPPSTFLQTNTKETHAHLLAFFHLIAKCVTSASFAIIRAKAILLSHTYTPTHTTHTGLGGKQRRWHAFLLFASSRLHGAQRYVNVIVCLSEGLSILARKGREEGN